MFPSPHALSPHVAPSLPAPRQLRPRRSGSSLHPAAAAPLSLLSARRPPQLRRGGPGAATSAPGDFLNTRARGPGAATLARWLSATRIQWRGGPNKVGPPPPLATVEAAGPGRGGGVAAVRRSWSRRQREGSQPLKKQINQPSFNMTGFVANKKYKM